MIIKIIKDKACNSIIEKKLIQDKKLLEKALKNKKICCACGKPIPKNHNFKKSGQNYLHTPACVVY